MQILNLSGFHSVPIIRQSEAAECGLACVGMIAGAYGYHTTISELRQKYPISMKGVTLADISTIASHLNFGTRGVRCDLDELKLLRSPVVIHWDTNHFVVMVKATDKYIIVHDPATGRSKLPLREASKHFTRMALEFSPTPGFKSKRRPNPIRFTSLIKFNNSIWQSLLFAVVASFLFQCFLLTGPYFSQIVIDEAVMKNDADLLLVIALCFATIKVFEGVASFMRNWGFQYISHILRYDVETGLFFRLVRLPLTYFKRRHIGDIQQRFLSLQPILEFISSGAITALIDGILAISLVVVIFAYDDKLSWIVIAFLVVYILLRLAFLALVKRLSGDWIVAQAKEDTRFLETLRAAQTIKVTGTEYKRDGLYRNLVANTQNASIRLANLNVGYESLRHVIFGISNIVVIYFAASSVLKGNMTVGMIMAFITYKGMFEQSIMAIVEQYVNFRLLEVHLERVSDIALQTEDPMLARPPSSRLLRGNLEFQNISFRYAKFEEPIIKFSNFSVKSGECVLITGKSGAGKSTLIKLLLGLYMPTSGKILIDGIDVQTLGSKNLRSQIGAVMQDDQLLAGSISENISMFSEKQDMNRIIQAAKAASIHDTISQSSMQYQSLIGDMGNSLSGGEIQRILIARALYNQPRILVLDEGTNALDTETERSIYNSIQKLAITRIIVSHRSSIIASADRVIEVKDGFCIQSSPS